jgi:hypothetical protein
MNNERNLKPHHAHRLRVYPPAKYIFRYEKISFDEIGRHEAQVVVALTHCGWYLKEGDGVIYLP